MIELSDLEFPVPYHHTWDIHDASKISMFMTCPRKYFFKYVLGWGTDLPNIHLVFGEAWHRAMAHILKHGLSAESISTAHDKFSEYYNRFFNAEDSLQYAPKSIEGALLALVEYDRTYKDSEDYELIHTEVAGTVPIHEDYKPLHFRLDSILRNKTGQYISMDHKTSSRQTGTWGDQWILSMQMCLYSHVLFCQYNPEDVYGMIINGVFLRKNAPKGSETVNGFQRVPIRKTISQMQVWLWNVIHWLDEIQWNFEELAKSKEEDDVLMAFPMNTNSCVDFGRVCEYHAFCTAWSNPLQRAHEPPPGMSNVWWNPADKEKEVDTVIHIEKPDYE